LTYHIKKCVSCTFYNYFQFEILSFKDTEKVINAFFHLIWIIAMSCFLL